MKLETINIKLSESETLELSLEQAKELHSILDGLFKKEVVTEKIVEKHHEYYPWDIPYNWWEVKPLEITYGGDTYIGTGQDFNSVNISLKSEV